MANFIVGLDFGTSLTKICLLRKREDDEIREFLKFDNSTCFLPSLVVRKKDNTFSYGDETAEGIKYRYFKMAAAEDIDLIKVTNEDLEGNIKGPLDSFRKYSTDFEIKPEIIVVLYLAYLYLYIKMKTATQVNRTAKGLLERLATKKDTHEHTYTVNLGIPTEWNNPSHIKRKIKFQTILLIAIELANTFDNIEKFLSAKDSDLFSLISTIKEAHLKKLNSTSTDTKAEIITNWLNTYKLSVFSESAAGVTYLLKNKRLQGYHATLDIGAGTSDIAIFRVVKNRISEYFCSESVEIAANDVYREYAKQTINNDTITFDDIKKTETCIKEGLFDKEIYGQVLIAIKKRGIKNLNGPMYEGIEFAIRKTFYLKYFINLFRHNQKDANRKRDSLNQKSIIVFGGGASLQGFSEGSYCFFKGANNLGNDDKCFEAKSITNYVPQISTDITNMDDVQTNLNQVLLALGLTYMSNEENGMIPFNSILNGGPNTHNKSAYDKYFYYDLQDAVYK